MSKQGEPDWDPADVLFNRGDAVQAAAWFMLANSSFTRIDSCVVRDRPDRALTEKSIKGFRAQEYSTRDIELLVNHLHMWDLINRDSSFGVQYLVAEHVVTGWLTVLERDFPELPCEALIEFDDIEGVQFSVASCTEPTQGRIHRVGKPPVTQNHWHDEYLPSVNRDHGEG